MIKRASTPFAGNVKEEGVCLQALASDIHDIICEASRPGEK